MLKLSYDSTDKNQTQCQIYFNFSYFVVEFLFCFGILFFETWFLCTALEPVLELVQYTSLTSNSQRFFCLCLLNYNIKGETSHPGFLLLFY